MKNLKFFAIFLPVFTVFSTCSAVNVSHLVAQAEKIVSDGLKNEDSRIKVNAIEVASETGQIKLAPQIAKLIESPVVPVRFSAAITIGDLQYQPGRKNLKKLLNDADVNVRIAAAYALYRFGEKKYISVIQSSAKEDDMTVQSNVAMLLGKLKSTESLPILYKLKDNRDASDIVTFNATEAIARIGDEKIYGKIWAMLISAYADDRYMGILAMGALGGTKGSGALLTMLDDDVLELRLSAAEQLGKLGDPTGAEDVLEYLTKSEPKEEKQVIERRNAIAALAIGSIADEKLIEYLPKFLKSESVAVRMAAAKSVLTLASANAKTP